MAQALIFDLDETLVDSRQSIAEYYRALFAHMGWPLPPPHDADAWRRLLREPERDVAAAHDPSEDTWRRVLDYKRNVDSFSLRALVALKPGAEDVLRWASERYLLALSTNRGASTDDLLIHLGIAGYFQLVYHAVNSVRLKPDPWVIEEVCRQFALFPEQTVFIGDSSHDVSCARAAGACSVAVGDDWRAGPHQPDFVIATIADLPTLVSRENL